MPTMDNFWWLQVLVVQWLPELEQNHLGLSETVGPRQGCRRKQSKEEGSARWTQHRLRPVLHEGAVLRRGLKLISFMNADNIVDEIRNFFTIISYLFAIKSWN